MQTVESKHLERRAEMKYLLYSQCFAHLKNDEALLKHESDPPLVLMEGYALSA